MTRARRTQRGVALIITLGVIAGLVVVVAAVAENFEVAQAARSNRDATQRARLEAMNGIQYALSALQGQSATSATQQDNWALLGTSAYADPANVRYTVNDGTFRVQIVDACGLIDLNTASQAQLTNLPLLPEQVDSLLDWRSAGETPRADGAKDPYYNSLANPYNAKLGRLDTIDELLQIQYFTRDTVYDVPTTTTNVQLVSSGTEPTLASICTVDASSPGLTGAGRTSVTGRGGNLQQFVRSLETLGLPANIATLIAQRRPFTTFRALLELPGVTNAEATTMLNSLSVSGTRTVEGKLNLNTATEASLNSLPDITPDLTNGIITYQTTTFASLGDLMSVPGMTPATAATIADDFGVASQTFLVRTIGTVGSTSVALQATVTIASGTPQIVKIEDEPFPNMDVRWNWADVAGDTTLVDPSDVQKQA